jgi:ubiquinone/menaquinone biosynthesis C-methylase UbiE
VVLILWAVAVVHAVWGRWHPFVLESFVGLLVLATVIGYIYSTRRGKFLVWEKLLDGLRLQGNEKILDMGCGRGAVLVLAAKRLTDQGRAFGLDLWSSVDQSGNNYEATLRNLRIEGVTERVSVATGNMMSMPFPDNMFDVVVSSLAIHNIKGQRGRMKALDEAHRVLKPGGTLLAMDLLPMVRVYAKHLKELEIEDVQDRSLDWRCWFGLPGMVRLITAYKPL